MESKEFRDFVTVENRKLQEFRKLVEEQERDWDKLIDNIKRDVSLRRGRILDLAVEIDTLIDVVLIAYFSHKDVVPKFMRYVLTRMNALTKISILRDMTKNTELCNKLEKMNEIRNMFAHSLRDGIECKIFNIKKNQSFDADKLADEYVKLHDTVRVELMNLSTNISKERGNMPKLDFKLG